MTSERCTRVHRARKRRCSLHAQARLRFARCALLRLCRNACRAIFAFALMSKLLDANCLIIEKTNSNGENRRFSTSIPFKYLYNKSGGTISMSPLVFYSVIPKCDSPLFYAIYVNIYLYYPLVYAKRPPALRIAFCLSVKEQVRAILCPLSSVRSISPLSIPSKTPSIERRASCERSS